MDRAAIALGILSLAISTAAQAATFVVTKTVDSADGRCDADCSLREAVQAANQTAGADIIRLTHAYYVLTRTSEDDDDNAVAGDLDLTDDVTVRGLADRSVIDARGIDRVLEVAFGVRAELIDISLRNGRVSGRGGGIYNEGDLTLRRVWVSGSRVTAAPVAIVQGGGIYNGSLFGSAQLRLIACRIYGNFALDDATLAGGQGGGLFNQSGSAVYLYDTDVRGNRTGLDDAAGFGAGLYNAGQARIDRSFFGYNDPGDGEGSAVANRAGGSLALFNSTVSANGHDGADGAIANGTLTDAGETRSNAYLFNATVANNNGGGMLNTGRLRLRNTIIAGNYTQDGHDRWYDVGKNCHNELSGDITQAYSVIGADGNCPGDFSVHNHSVFSTLLEHLRYLGGPTPVHLPRSGSLAIDNGDPSACPAWDQRLGRRPADGDMDGVEECDIGAAEVNADE